MKTRVRLFAVARELAGRDTLELELPADATIADVRQTLAAQLPALAAWLPHLRFAVGTRYVTDSNPVEGAPEIVCIPPVSGG